MLEDNSNNEELEKYLTERSSGYESASLGETSADELQIVGSDSDGVAGVDIYRDSPESKRYQEAEYLATAVQDYETSVIQHHRNKDLYYQKSKKFNQISFKDLNLQEQLNYIKYTIKDTREAF